MFYPDDNPWNRRYVGFDEDSEYLVSRGRAHTNGMFGLINHDWSMSTRHKIIVDYLNEAGYETVWVRFQHERKSSKDNHYQMRLHHRSDGRLK